MKEPIQAVVEARRSWHIEHRHAVWFLKSLPDESVDVIFMDPPYNLGFVYKDDPEADRMDPSQYGSCIRTWLESAKPTLKRSGSLWIVISDEWAAEYVVEAKKQGFHLRNWIKWHETFGVYCTLKFGRTSRHILYFVKDKRCHYFNPDLVRVESERQRLGDKRANPDGKVMGDVWEIPRIPGNAKARIKDVPTQLPVEIPSRAIRSTCPEGGLVIDPFCGSGTTGVAALRHGCRFLGCDRSHPYVEIAHQRLVAASGRGEESCQES